MAWRYDPDEFRKRVKTVRLKDVPDHALTTQQAVKKWGYAHRNSVIRLIQLGRIEAVALDDGTLFITTKQKPEALTPGRKPDKEDE